MSRTKNCEFCSEEISNAATRYQYLSGWSKTRTSGGGQHGLSLAEYEHRFACFTCIDKLKKKLSLDQTTIFDAGA